MNTTETIDHRLAEMRDERVSLTLKLDELNAQLVADITDAALRGRKPRDESYLRGQIAETAAHLHALDAALENESVTRQAAERADAGHLLAEIVTR